MGNISGAVIALVSGFIGLAIVAVIVSKQGQTPAVLQGAGSALAQVIGAAVSPVSGNSFGSVAGNIPGVSS